MDGSLSEIQCRFRALLPERAARMASCWRSSLLLGVSMIACFDVADAADPPRLFRRWGGANQANPKALPKTELEQRPVINQTSANVAQDLENTPSKPQVKSDPSRDIGTPQTNGLSRFPQKSMTGPSTSRTAIDDSNLEEAESPIDLPTALGLAGMNSPQVLLAQQRVLAVTAHQQLAAAQALPNLNLGTNYDQHTGVLQQPSGNILNVERSDLYVGAGAYAVGSGTVNLPGLQYNLNVGESYYSYLTSRQLSERSRAVAQVTRNNILMQLAVAYCQLVRSQGAR